jgi:NTP pyrophosphatase (non-canonical NTP hydrolase)
MDRIAKFSLDDLYFMVAHIYSEQNAQRSVTSTFSHFVEVCGMLTAHSRRKRREELSFETALCKALGWFFPLLAKCRVKSIEELVFRKFPYACPYCREAPHRDLICKSVKGTAATVDHAALRSLRNANSQRRPRGLIEWQDMFAAIYPRSTEDTTRSTLGLMEELGELGEAIRIYDRHPKFFAGEVADVFSYLMGLANEYSISCQVLGKPAFDFETEFLARYPGVCLACGNKICQCPAVPEATIGRMSKELELDHREEVYFADLQVVAERGARAAEEVLSYVGGIGSVLRGLPLDRGEVNQALVLLCIALADAIDAANPTTAADLRSIALRVGVAQTPAGSRSHSFEANKSLETIRKALTMIPKDHSALATQSSTMIRDVAQMLSGHRVLVVSVSPLDQPQIGADLEVRTIVASIRRSRDRDRIGYELLVASTIDDFRQKLLEGEYTIVHFAGHGTQAGIILTNEAGDASQLTYKNLRAIVQRYPSIQCVILNSCYTLQENDEPLAPFTVGMTAELGDAAAVEFARGFYDAIGANKEIQFAIEEGRVAVTAKGMDGDLPIKVLRK